MPPTLAPPTLAEQAAACERISQEQHELSALCQKHRAMGHFEQFCTTGSIMRQAAATLRSHAAALSAAEAREARLREALEPFARIKPSSFYPPDGSEAEPYVVVLSGPLDQGDFTGDDLARARAALETPS